MFSFGWFDLSHLLFPFQFYSHFSFFTSLFLPPLPLLLNVRAVDCFSSIFSYCYSLVDSYYYVATECYAFVFLWSQIAMLFPLSLFFYIFHFAHVWGLLNNSFACYRHRYRHHNILLWLLRCHCCCYSAIATSKPNAML